MRPGLGQKTDSEKRRRRCAASHLVVVGGKLHQSLCKERLVFVGREALAGQPVASAMFVPPMRLANGQRRELGAHATGLEALSPAQERRTRVTVMFRSAEGFWRGLKHIGRI